MHAAAAMGGKIYVTGGEDEGGGGSVNCLGLRVRPARRRMDAAGKHEHRPALPRLRSGGIVVGG